MGWALKKMIQIERDPRAGDPLLGGLIGYRKITVGDRDWRIVWRVVQDQAGGFRVEVAEVWAVGYRKEGEVYEEIRRRVADAGPSPRTKALTDVLELFAKQSSDLTATPDQPSLNQSRSGWPTHCCTWCTCRPPRLRS